ncbi:MAG: hypothetical protein ACLSHL_09565 [Alistipes communis]
MADVKKLTFDDIKTSFDGDSWIIAHRKKTGTPFHVKLLPVAMQLIEKYRPAAKDNRVFPSTVERGGHEPGVAARNEDMRHRQVDFDASRAVAHTFAATVTLSQGAAGNQSQDARTPISPHHADLRQDYQREDQS